MNLLYILAPLILVVLIIFTLILHCFRKSKGSSTVDSSNKIVYEFMNGDTSYEEICKVYPVDKITKRYIRNFMKE